MAERFRIGEIAILILAPGEIPHPDWAPYIGQEVEVVGGLRKRQFKGAGPASAYVVRSQDGRKFGAQPINLRKKRLPPPREELGEWDLCPWKPAQHVTVSSSQT